MWPFKKKEVPEAPKEPAPPMDGPIQISAGFPEYVTLAESIEFAPSYLIREILRQALGKLGVVREFSYDAVRGYLSEVSRLRGTQFSFQWLRAKDQKAAKTAAPRSCGDYGIERGFVPARALELVQHIENKLGAELPKVEVKLADGTVEQVSFLIFSVTLIPKGDGEQVFLAVQDSKMKGPDIFICSWKNDDNLEYSGEGAKDL